MGACCTCRQAPRPQRRINGLQLPLNFLQVMGWIVFIATTLINFMVVIEIQFHELKVVSIITYVILYVCHVSSHVLAALIDPSERELRKLKVNNVPEFDRSVHAHVIENGRCHLCNIYTSSKYTKHCSLCNKCVDHFDHHCKWLNNCVGQRNYAAFITCITTALLIASLTTILCLTDIVLFLAHPSQLSLVAQNFINCTNGQPLSNNVKYCRSSVSFLIFLVIFGVSALVIACALLHLCCFHVYISILGVSTYEYVVKGSTKKAKPNRSSSRCKCCLPNISRNPESHDVKDAERSQTNVAEVSEDASEAKIGVDGPAAVITKYRESEERNMTGLIHMILANEIVRAKKRLLYDKNKIHPGERNEQKNS